MAKRRARKPVKEVPASAEGEVEGNDKKETRIEENKVGLFDQEVERQCAAIRAVRDVEIEHMLTALCLLRSYYSEEQRQTPALQFFNENLPNLSVVRNAENGQFEVQWKHEDGNISIHNADGRDIHASLLHRMSIAYANCPGIPSFGGFELSTETERTNLIGADSQQIKDFVLEGTSESQMFGVHDALQTPGVTGQRFSIGMTPKTLRLPKPGEMLLSVHGSPLGVCKEDNMEAINGMTLVEFAHFLSDFQGQYSAGAADFQGQFSFCSCPPVGGLILQGQGSNSGSCSKLGGYPISPLQKKRVNILQGVALFCAD